MDEIVAMAERFHNSPNLFPWVLTIVVGSVLWKERKLIKQLFNSKIEQSKEAHAHNVVVTELIRNNTAALENNTAALEAVNRERDAMVAALKHHEELSTERDGVARIIMERMDKRSEEMNRIIHLVEDRTDN